MIEKKLLEPFKKTNKFKLTGEFYKAALVGNAAVTAYLVSDHAGYSAMVALFFLLHSKVHENIPAFVIDKNLSEIKKGSAGSLSDQTDIGKSILALKRKAGIEQDIEIVIMRDEASSPVSICSVGGAIKILISQTFLNSTSVKDVVHVVAHELAHAKNDDLDEPHKLSYASYATNLLNILSGTINFCLSMNPLPLMAAFGGKIVNKALIIKIKQNKEYWADYFAAKIVGPRDYYETFQRTANDKNNLVVNAVLRREALISLPPSVLLLPELLGFEKFCEMANSKIRKFLKPKKVPEFLIDLQTLKTKIFVKEHPYNDKRLNEIAKLVQETDADFQHPFPDELTDISVCRRCAKVSSDLEEHNVVSFLKSEHANMYGHKNLRVKFTDTCANDLAEFKELGTIIMDLNRKDSPKHLYL